MRKLLLTCLIFGSASLFAATPSEFYLDLLRRGVAEVEGGRPENATTLLRLAAFGLVESIEHYETAHVHLAVASDRLGDVESARDAAHRVVAAEKVERRYASLQLAAPVRTSFDAVAKKTLSAPDLALLTAKPAPETTSVPQALTTPQKPAPGPSTAANGSAPKPAPTTTVTSPPKRATPAPTPSAPPAPNSTQTGTATSPNSTQTANATQSSSTKPPAPVQKPVESKPVTTTQKPAVAPVETNPVATQPKPPAPAPVDVAAQLAAGDRALAAANLAEARRIYRALLPLQNLDRRMLIRLAEGLYRARDFATALQAFRRLGTFRSGEEPYHYYVAVAMYETGDHAGAKRELEAALPHIQLTPDVQRYRAKIEGTR